MRQAITTQRKMDRNGNSYLLVRCPALKRAKKLDFDHGRNDHENHISVAETVANEFEWLDDCELQTGCISQDMYCHVLTDKQPKPVCPDCIGNIVLRCPRCHC